MGNRFSEPHQEGVKPAYKAMEGYQKPEVVLKPQMAF
jgi:hypothetical protein